MIPTLSLCIITYHADAKDLKRCLSSITSLPGLLDEIIIVDTSQELSSEITSIAQQFNGRLFHRAFQDDFSDVRNYSFDQASGDCILWLDCDDIVSESQLKKFIALKQDLNKYDVWLCDYVYAWDQAGKPALILPRERIVKKCPEIRWVEPVHECLTIQNSTMVRTDIQIEHHRAHGGSPERNLRILKKQYEKNSLSERGTFYYGKELFDSGSTKEAAEIFEQYIQTAPGKDFVDNIATACHKLAQYYGTQDNYGKAKITALRSLQFSQNYSEAFVLLGDLYQLTGNLQTAKEYYTRALSCRLGSSGMSQLPQFYHYIPHRSLAFLYNKISDSYNAKRHASIALSYQADDELKKMLGNTDIEPKVAFLFPGKADPINGSQRIRRINLSKALSNSLMIEYYLSLPFADLISKLQDRNVVVFQNFCYPDLVLMKALKALNKIVLFDDCEAISNYPYQAECMREASAITCCSETLAELRSKQGCEKVAIIPDAWEPTIGEPDYSRTKLKAGYFGMGGNSFLVTSWLRSTIEAHGYELVVCTEWDDATVKWNPDTWASEMYGCDVILCPQRVDVQPAKSNVKITQAMSMGLPIICSPLPAYTKIVRHGVNGYIASNPEEWGQALGALKDLETRRSIGQAGRASIGLYSIDAVKTYYNRLLGDLLIMGGTTIEPNKSAEPVKAQEQSETVDIIIPLYNNFPYLRQTLDSILLNTTPDTPYRIIISDAGSTEETWEQLKALKGMLLLGNPKQRLNFAEACNQGIFHSNSKFFVIMNSDVIVSKGWLTAMKKKMETVDRLACCGPLSNCDIGFQFHPNDYSMKVNNGLILRPGMKIEEVTPHLGDLYNFMSKHNEQHKDKFMEKPWTAAYCNIYAKSGIEEVGLFDPTYQNNAEDLDLAKRITAFGYKIGIAVDAFVFHYGGITRLSYEQEGK